MIILCNGMIRSGSTLQYNIVKDLLKYSSKNHKLLGFLTKEEINNKSDINLIEKSLDLNTIYLVKSHDYTILNELSNVFVIYSYRNLLDVAGSQKRKFGTANEKLLIAIDKSVKDYYRIVNSKLLLSQKYENLLEKLNDCVEEICHFIDIQIDEQTINKIVANNSTAKVFKEQNNNRHLKSIKVFLGKNVLPLNKNVKNCIIFLLGKKFAENIRRKLTPHDENTLFHLNHISQNLGENGKWEEILSEKEIKRIKTKYNEWLEFE